MSRHTETIPKDLPSTDPLLFSFLMITDAVNFQIKLDGKQELTDADLPALNYAVNSWKVADEQDSRGNTCKMVSLDVLAAIWKNKPKAEECKIEWKKYPSGTTREEVKKRVLPMPFKYEFENWRNQTFDELDQIISGLVYRGPERGPKPLNKKLLYLPDLFGWEIAGNEVKYVYAGDVNTAQMYGVGAAFVLKTPYMNCCPKMDETKLTKEYFQSIGFTMENCFDV